MAILGTLGSIIRWKGQNWSQDWVFTEWAWKGNSVVIYYNIVTGAVNNNANDIIIVEVKAELDKTQGDQSIRYNDFNDSRQKIQKLEMEIERLRQENDR